MKPLPSLKHPAKPVSHAADLLESATYLDSTIPTQVYKTRCCWQKEPWLQVQHACKVGLKELCQHASCKHMNIMVSVDGNFCSHLGTVFRAVPDCMQQTSWGATRLN